MDMAFLESIPKEFHWVSEGGAPLVAGRGTPLQTYVTLLQLKSARITFGQVTQAKMSIVVNARTCLQLESLRRRHPGVAVDKLIEQTQSGVYGSTNLTQAGSIVKGMKVKGGSPESVGELARRAKMDDAELQKLGLSRQRHRAFVWLRYRDRDRAAERRKSVKPLERITLVLPPVQQRPDQTPLRVFHAYDRFVAELQQETPARVRSSKGRRAERRVTACC